MIICDDSSVIGQNCSMILATTLYKYIFDKYYRYEKNIKIFQDINTALNPRSNSHHRHHFSCTQVTLFFFFLKNSLD